jgi:hypothetical protein
VGVRVIVAVYVVPLANLPSVSAPSHVTIPVYPVPLIDVTGIAPAIGCVTPLIFVLLMVILD